MKRERRREEEEEEEEEEDDDDERYGNYVCMETICVWNTMVFYG